MNPIRAYNLYIYSSAELEKLINAFYEKEVIVIENDLDYDNHWTYILRKNRDYNPKGSDLQPYDFPRYVGITDLHDILVNMCIKGYLPEGVYHVY